MKYRRLIPAVAALAVAACMQPDRDAGQAQDPDRYTIAGDLSAVCDSGEFALWTAEPDSRSIVAQAQIVDGRILLEGTVDAPRIVYFEILNATVREGYRMASVKSQPFVLEPGELTLTMDARTEFIVQGGPYNDIVVNSWRLSPEYLRLRDDYLRADRPVDGETRADRQAREAGASELFEELLRLESRGRRRVALGHEDPLARKLTIQSTWLRGPWIADALRQLAEMIPHDPWVAESLAFEEAYAAEQARAAAFDVGSEVRDFEAETLDGEIVSVSGAREGKAVILLEFWASWCGPCRVEIPHMKQAYADYGPQGFEIFSFTVDDERDDWIEASEEEEIPWINAGMGVDHAATEAYGVTGIPANFLVDASSGAIIASDLRGRKLDEALAERFGTSRGGS